jgi:hypothetical protein
MEREDRDNRRPHPDAEVEAHGERIPADEQPEPQPAPERAGDADDQSDVEAHRFI